MATQKMSPATKSPSVMSWARLTRPSVRLADIAPLGRESLVRLGGVNVLGAMSGPGQELLVNEDVRKAYLGG